MCPLCAAEAQLELELPAQGWGAVKRGFANVFVAKDSVKITLGCSRMGVVTSQTGTGQKGFNTSFASVFNTDDGARGSQYSKLEGHD